MSACALVRAALAALLAWSASGCNGAALETPPNVLLIVLDTVRADRLSAYGYPRPTTPELERFAAEAVTFERFVSNASWTLPAHASLFTGRLAAEHGATQEHLVFSAPFTTLAEQFRGAGYATFAASANPVVSPANGLDRGFERFDETYRQPDVSAVGGRHKNQVALDRFFDSLAAQGGERPWFAFLNYLEVHLPYWPPEPHRSRFLRASRGPRAVARARGARVKEHYRGDRGLPAATFSVLGDLYDGEVAYLDALIGQLLISLRERSDFENTVIAITSDHGEHLGEGGRLGHVFSIHNALLNVPLWIRLPGAERGGTRRGDVGQLLDLFPTLLAQAGIEPPPGLPGRDLFEERPGPSSSGTAGTAGTAATAIAEYYYPEQVFVALGGARAESNPRLALFRRRLRSIQDARYKWVVGSDGTSALYDLEADPAESRDLSRHAPLAAARERLADILAAAPSPPPRPSVSASAGESAEGAWSSDDADLVEQLRALGYAE